MRYLVGLLFAVSCFGVEVTAITFPYVGHGSLAVEFSTMTASIGARVRYGTSSCSAGTGGTVQTYFQSAIAASAAQYSIGGLAPSTLYYVCPEVTKNGSTWSIGAEGTVTTAALPARHPALPIAPLNFNSDYPNTSGYFTYTVASDCSDFGTAYSGAVSRWATQGTIIAIPAGTVCNGGPYAFASTPPDVHTWQPSDVSTGASTITWTAHGFSEGDLVAFGRTYAATTTYPASTTCDIGYSTLAGGGIQSGQRYQVHVVNANTIQVRCLPATQVDPATPSSTPATMIFTTQGSTSTGGFYAVPFTNTGTTANPIWERRLPSGALTPYIIVRSASTNLPPEHTQITPAWQSSMAIFQDPVANITNTNTAHPFIIFGNTDPNYEIPVGNIRIGPGVEITTADYATSVHSSDPRYWNYVWATYPWDSNITCDRCYYHMLGAPNREQIGVRWDGSNMAFIDSYWDNLTYFHATNSGLALTQSSGTVAALASGTAYAGVATIPLASPVNITFSGSGTGRAFVFFNLLSSNALTVAVPSGITAACSGATCFSATAGTNAGTCTAMDGWPKTGANEVTVQQLGCVDLTAGTITAVISSASGNGLISAWNAEGDSHMLGGTGPGPYKLIDNYSEGAGLTWHWDDGGGAQYRGDYTIQRNYLFTNRKYMHGSTTSDGMYYFARQNMEHKGGQRIRLNGNVSDGGWREMIPQGVFYAATPRQGGWVTDLNATNNTYRNAAGVFSGINATCDAGPELCARPAVRSNFSNNLIYNIDGYTFAALNPIGNSGVGIGSTFQVEALEDFTTDHNTFLVARGTFPWALAITGPFIEGLQHTNNVEFYNGIPTQTATMFGDLSGASPPPGCTGINVAFLNCALTQGVGNTSYQYGNNLIIGGYTDGSVPSGQSTTSTMGTALTGLTNSFLASGTVSGSLTAAKWFNAVITADQDYHFRNDSAYVAGSNPYGKGADLGANIDALNAAQGLLAMISVNPVGTTTATLNYVAADSGACSVGTSTTNDITTAAFASDGGGPRVRNVALTGLTTRTAYYYWTLCSGNSVLSQKSGQFKTN